MDVKQRPSWDSAWMGDQSGGINSRRARVDHVAVDH